MLWKVGKEIIDQRQLFGEIRRSDWPIGVVVFDIEGNLRSAISEECTELLPGLKTLGPSRRGTRMISEASELIKQKENALLMVDGLSSAHHDTRCNVITSLKACGAKTVVGIYAEQDAIITSLTHNDPPSKDGLDYCVNVR